MGPLLAAFETNTQPWPTAFWVYFAMTALGLVLSVALLRETYYDRSLPADEQPSLGNRLSSVTGLAQWKSRHLRNSPGQACWRVISVVLKPTVFLACVYYLLVRPLPTLTPPNTPPTRARAHTHVIVSSREYEVADREQKKKTFGWVVGINTTLSIFLGPQYNFGLKQIGFFYFTPIVAALLGEVTGHWLHDVLARQYIRAHGGRFEPEARLRAIFVAVPFMMAGLILLGQALENDWHYMAASVSWGMFVFGTMITTVGVSSYCLDSYPEASGEVSCWVNFSRTIGGFIISYFQVEWATVEGAKTSFGIQGGICGAAFLIVLALGFWGKKLRIWAGPLNFATV